MFKLVIASLIGISGYVQASPHVQLQEVPLTPAQITPYSNISILPTSSQTDLVTLTSGPISVSAAETLIRVGSLGNENCKIDFVSGTAQVDQNQRIHRVDVRFKLLRAGQAPIEFFVSQNFSRYATGVTPRSFSEVHPGTIWGLNRGGFLVIRYSQNTLTEFPAGGAFRLDYQERQGVESLRRVTFDEAGKDKIVLCELP